MKKATLAWIGFSLMTTVPFAMATDSGFRIFGGGGMGYSSVASKNDYASSPDGAHYLLGLSGAYETRKWAYDLGLGWMYSKANGADATGLPIDIRTRSAIASLSPRIRLSERWQLGPSLDLAFGADTRQGPSVGTSNKTLFGGLKATYQMPLSDRWLGRAVFQGSTDVSVSSRRLFMAMAGLQIGLPIRKQAPRGALTVKESTPVEELRISLDPQAVFFKTNSSKLRPDVEVKFKEVGEYLAGHPDSWSSLRIAGHADRRGKYSYNLKLSDRRANAVKDALSVPGISEEKIDSEALGFSKPIDSSSGRLAWARNRRVELVFYNVKDPETIREKLEPLTPQTFKDALDES